MLSFNFGNSCKFFILASSPSFLYLPTSVGHTHEWKTVFVAVCGSSPPTWGIPSPCTRTSNHSRFIPTYVGHTPLRTVRENFITVHPHIRGAYLRPHTSRYSGIGSSPHTWGIQAVNLLRPQIIRFIPTYVGHTPGSRCPAHCGSVHPHIRGAYTRINRCLEPDGGSSPHTWGIPYIRPFGCSHPRFIPTYVGHTLDRRKKNGWFQPLLL